MARQHLPAEQVAFRALFRLLSQQSVSVVQGPGVPTQHL